MQYLWESFNIKTYPAWTIVFVDGVYNTEISTISEFIKINGSDIEIKNYDNKLPVHIIYIGKITKDIKLNININSSGAKINFTGKFTIEKPVESNIFIKNTGKNSVFDAKFVINNKSDLVFNIIAGHFKENTGNFVYTKVIANTDSSTILSGTSQIEKNINNCESDVSFAAFVADNIKKLVFTPCQYINSVPKTANHAAFIWRASKSQIEYLRTSGLSTREIDDILRQAFKDDI